MPEHEQKMKDRNWFLGIDEIILFLIGITVFAFSYLEDYRIYFIGIIIIWFWFKLRYYESQILKKGQEIYNEEINCYYGQTSLESIAIPRLEAKKKPIQYKLNQLERKRKNLIDKFVVVNLIILILIEIFIRK